MRTTAIIIGIVLATGWGNMAAAAFAAPSDAQIEAMLADPSLVATVLEGASATEAADVVLRGIAQIDASEMTEDQKKQAIALLVARVVALQGAAAPQMMASLCSRVSADWLSTVVAAGYVAAGENGEAVLVAVVEALGPETEAAALARAAAADPETALGLAILELIRARPARDLGVRGVGARTSPRPPTPPTAPTPPTPPTYGP